MFRPDRHDDTRPHHEERGASRPPRRRGILPPFPFTELVRVLLLPTVAVAIFVVLFMRQPSGGPAADEREGFERVTLLQKDGQFQAVPPERGGASGTVWYTPSGPAFAFELEAKGLTPRKRYLLELAVDERIYTLASYTADGDGELSVDSTLTQFAEGACTGADRDPPTPLAGQHLIKFWLKRNGAPGGDADKSRSFGDGGDPCGGNGDGDYTYVLLENEIARYAGTSSAKTPPAPMPST